MVTDNEGAPADYIFLEINATLEELTGLKREKVIGKKVTEVLPAHIADMLMTGIEKALASGEMQIFEYSYNTKNSEHYFEARL